ncbi:MAG: class I SAM-dependent methyltransferase [Alphaproteobacteria bacterium]
MMEETDRENAAAEADARDAWNHSTRDEFYRYYAAESLSEATMRRFLGVRDAVLKLRGDDGADVSLDVVDIGCGAGASSLIWAELGHRVRGLDINEALVELARQRAREAGCEARFDVASATDIPWEDESADVCVVPELLEHVADWEGCLDEVARILRPKGILYLSTSSKLCPRQHEFNLPLYSWYPAPLKHRFERLAVTTRPALANYATYPAVNWFSFSGLRAALAARGFREFHDRFDSAALRDGGALRRGVLAAIRMSPVTRWLGYVATEGTIIIAVKGDG